ncbi:MAG: SCO family protein [Verrucomicrobiales bacterium]
MADRLHAGDVVPDFAFVDHTGAARSLNRASNPRAILLTFIFTRCSMMEFCPRMSLKFQEVRQSLDATDFAESVELISITLDPVHDSPEALASYATTFAAPAGRWTFARCEPDVLATLQSRFGIHASPTGPGGSIEHNLVTALIAPDGRLLQCWEGNTWTTEEIVAETQAALAPNQPIAATPLAP